VLHPHFLLLTVVEHGEGLHDHGRPVVLVNRIEWEEQLSSRLWWLESCTAAAVYGFRAVRLVPGCAEDQGQQQHGGAGQVREPVFKNIHAHEVPGVHGEVHEHVLGEVQGPHDVWTGKYRQSPVQVSLQHSCLFSCATLACMLDVGQPLQVHHQLHLLLDQLVEAVPGGDPP
jgi:hypothetical protein